MSLILKLFGLLDLGAAAALLLANTDWVPARWILFLGGYLAFKGFVFAKGNAVSKFDILLGGYLLLAGLLTMPATLNTLLGIYLGLKALYSFA